jgi:hypothetical protein
VLSGINKRGSERYKEENDMRRPIPKIEGKVMNVSDKQQTKYVMIRSYDCNKMEWYEHPVPLEIYQQSLSNL